MKIFKAEDKDYLQKEINNVIDNRINSKLLAQKLLYKSESFVKSKLKLLDSWGNKRIYKFDIEKSKEVLSNRFIVADTIAFFTTPTIENGNLFNRTGRIYCQTLFDKEDRYKVVVQYDIQGLYIHIAEVRREHQQSGLMNEMVEVIKDFAFNYYGAEIIFARADIPFFSLYSNQKSPRDWRSDINPSTKNTNLFDVWLKYGIKVDGWSGVYKENAFAIINPNYSHKDLNKFLRQKGFIID